MITGCCAMMLCVAGIEWLSSPCNYIHFDLMVVVRGSEENDRKCGEREKRVSERSEVSEEKRKYSESERNEKPVVGCFCETRETLLPPLLLAFCVTVTLTGRMREGNCVKRKVRPLEFLFVFCIFSLTLTILLLVAMMMMTMIVMMWMMTTTMGLKA